MSSIGIISTDQSGAESAPVTVMINGKPAGIYPGMTTEASITLVHKTHVLSVPSGVVHKWDPNLRRRTDQRPEGQPRRARGVVGADDTQIISGLSDGAKVVVQG